MFRVLSLFSNPMHFSDAYFLTIVAFCIVCCCHGHIVFLTNTLHSIYTWKPPITSIAALWWTQIQQMMIRGISHTNKLSRYLHSLGFEIKTFVYIHTERDIQKWEPFLVRWISLETHFSSSKIPSNHAASFEFSVSSNVLLMS